MRILRPPPPYVISEHLRAFSVPGRPSPHLLHGNLWTVVLDSPLAFEIRGEPWEPRILFEGDEEELSTHLRTDFDYREFLGSLEAFPRLRALAEKYPGLRPTRCTSLYRALISSIIKQRIPLRVALRVESELVSRMGRRARILGRPAYGLPDPERLLEAGIEGLRLLGLFRLKAEAMVEVAGAELEGRLPGRPWEDVEDAIRELTRIRGVGRWTAELAIAVVSPGFRMGPATDLAVRRGLQRLLGIPEQEAMGILGELEEYAGLIMYLAAHDYERGKRSRRRGGGQGHG